jgi:hypothetical protein
MYKFRSSILFLLSVSGMDVRRKRPIPILVSFLVDIIYKCSPFFFDNCRIKSVALCGSPAVNNVI